MSELRVGVVCEGPTDFYAISEFLTDALNRAGKNIIFVPIQPDMDSTRQDAGWTNVCTWLQKNSPETRASRYFGQGLFANDLNTKSCDVILVQIDTDFIGNSVFSHKFEELVGRQISISTNPTQRAAEMLSFLQSICKTETMTSADQGRYILLPMVEASETWCIGAFSRCTDNLEELSSAELTQKFMAVLLQSEGLQVNGPFAKTDKTKERRRDFCKRHRGGSRWLANSCAQFSICQDTLLNLP